MSDGTTLGISNITPILSRTESVTKSKLANSFTPFHIKTVFYEHHFVPLESPSYGIDKRSIRWVKPENWVLIFSYCLPVLLKLKGPQWIYWPAIIGLRKVFRFRRVNGNDLVIIGYASKIVSFENNIFGIFCKLITSTTRWTRGESSKYNLWYPISDITQKVFLIFSLPSKSLNFVAIQGRGPKQTYWGGIGVHSTHRLPRGE